MIPPDFLFAAGTLALIGACAGFRRMNAAARRASRDLREAPAVVAWLGASALLVYAGVHLTLLGILRLAGG